MFRSPPSTITTRRASARTCRNVSEQLRRVIARSRAVASRKSGQPDNQHRVAWQKPGNAPAKPWLNRPARVHAGDDAELVAASEAIPR